MVGDVGKRRNNYSFLLNLGEKEKRERKAKEEKEGKMRKHRTKKTNILKIVMIRNRLCIYVDTMYRVFIKYCVFP